MTSQLRTALSAADRFFLNLIPLLGLVCVFFSRHLTKILPLLMGSAMLIVGGLRLWHSLRDKEYLTLETNRAAGAVVLFVMGVVFLRAKGDALGLMGTTWGLIGLTKSVARELAGRGVTCNAICPGFIDTDMTRGVPEKVWDTMISKIPMGRAGSPADVANMVAFLASDEANYITGEVINVGGGMIL